MAAHISRPVVWFWILYLLGACCKGIYAARHETLAPLLDAARSFGVAWSLLLLWYGDEKKGPFRGVVDMGWFALMAWPLLAPYYLWMTRGWKGLRVVVLVVLLGMFALFVGMTIGWSTMN